MAIGKPKFYWDTAPLIAWIKDETREDASEMDGLAEVVELVESNAAILMTSVLWRAEVLDDSLDRDQKQRLIDVFKHRYIQELAIDGRVMQLAGEIRSYHKNLPSKDVIKKISTPDAIHLASAIQYDASEFHTFDGKKYSSNPGGLLTLNGNVAGHRLKICTPKAEQLRLNFKDKQNERIEHKQEDQNSDADD